MSHVITGIVDVLGMGILLAHTLDAFQTDIPGRHILYGQRGRYQNKTPNRRARQNMSTVAHHRQEDL